MNTRIGTLALSLFAVAALARCSVQYDETDTDNDGLQDFSDADDDGDGFSDLVELRCGSSPKDRASVPQAPAANDQSPAAVACRAVLVVDCASLRTTDGKKQGDSCTVPGQQGTCAIGVYLCSGTSLVCTSQNVTAEICDGIDNDCNHTVDDVPATACATGLQGICATGTIKCDGVQTVCDPTVKPGTQTETCNGLDDDCNGPADDDIPGVGGECDTGIPGTCAAGTLVCNGFAGTACVPKVQTAEVCDGEDNNCDRLVDNNVPGVNEPCVDDTKLGICRNGAYQCTTPTGENKPRLVCVTPSPMPEEICHNNLDDNCNGDVDEGAACTCIDGDGDGYGTGCAPGPDCNDNDRSIHPNVADPCDGVDNDCDNSTDEDFVPAACTADQAVGACRAGTTVCNHASGVVCQPGMPSSTELCNGVDDNCNGVPDSEPGEVNDPQANQSCLTGLPGDCNAGTFVCNGQSFTCQPTIQPGHLAEVCDGRDNNCDGNVDETFSISCAGPTWGATCTAANACARGLACASLEIGATEGTCVKVCTTAADCLSGMACQPIGGRRVCLALCDPLAVPAGCPDGQLCSTTGFCVPASCDAHTGTGCPMAAPTCQPQGFCTP